jgi:hypothetical protein
MALSGHRAAQIATDGDGRLEGIKAIIERQERVFAKSHDYGFFLDRQDRRFRLFRTGRKIGNGSAFLPFGNGLLIDAVAFRKRSQALFTVLYCSTDRLCRRGAAM